MFTNKLGEGNKASLCLLFVQRAVFFIALLCGIYSHNLSIVICIEKEPAVSPASSSVSIDFNWKPFLTVLWMYLMWCRSEANDLALRLARQYHGHQDVITLEK